MNQPSQQPKIPVDLQQRLDVFERFLKRGNIGWTTQRPFLKSLGTGGQGTVILTERRGAGMFSMPVALKFFSPGQFRTTTAYEEEMLRLTEVASMVARIQDDHLVDVHTFIENEGVYYMEMEWIDGFDLLTLLRRDTLEIVHEAVTQGRWEELNETIVTQGEVDCRLKPGMAVAILRECLSGVSALHRSDIVHCDLKPSNVMVKRTGQVKLIDVGAAFWQEKPPPGQACTLEYAAPEVLEGKRATPASDLASLGYMLLEMLSGSRPFTGLKYADLLEAKKEIIHKLPAMLPLDTFAHSAPLMLLLRRLVHPDPAERFQSAEDAELGQHGAAEFLNELVRSERSQEYASEIRQWISEMESELHKAQQRSYFGDTTRISPPDPTATRIFPDSLSDLENVTSGFDVN